MAQFIKPLVCVAAMGAISVTSVQSERVKTSWGGSGEEIYDAGFMFRLKKSPEGGVGLFNMELIENDSPGAGTSEKGVCRDWIWGKNKGRKILRVEDAQAGKAFLVVFFDAQGKYPLEVVINGHEGRFDNWDPKSCHLMYRWMEFPVEWLRRGDNTIDLACPEAVNEKDGWNLYLARADEFEHGGGDPKEAGQTSFKSMDGGRSWKQSPFGPDGQTRAEYSVRLNLDRYVKSGWLATPVIDLWRGNDTNFVVPIRSFQRLKLAVRSEVPEGTSVEYYLRRGTAPGPYAEGWSDYEKIGSGPVIDAEFDDRVIDGRYIQIKAVLSTANMLRTPRLQSIRVDAVLHQQAPSPDGLRVTELENPVIRYSSLGWEWEKWDRPEFTDLKSRENLDGVTAGSRAQFGVVTQLLEYATSRAPAGSPQPDYPGWDALSILNRLDRHGAFGFCLQFNNFLNGMCLAYGMQGRLVNGVNHEMAEVWSDDFGKWVYVDASAGGNHYMTDERTGIPMNLLDLHRAYMKYFFPDRPIDWMRDMVDPLLMEKRIDERRDKPPVIRSSSTYRQSSSPAYQGFVHAAFLRMIPRNNFYAKPFPVPLAHGTSWWPWDGYINWYDERTPPQRQYSRFTDRPCDMWPDLNRVHIDAVSCHHNKFVYLRFETYTPNFSRFEVDENDTGWNPMDGDRRTWVLVSGKNTLRVRSVNRLGNKGKPSRVVILKGD